MCATGPPAHNQVVRVTELGCVVLVCAVLGYVVMCCEVVLLFIVLCCSVVMCWVMMYINDAVVCVVASPVW